MSGRTFWKAIPDFFQKDLFSIQFLNHSKVANVVKKRPAEVAKEWVESKILPYLPHEIRYLQKIQQREKRTP